jgi:hypothetical protein
VITGFIYEWVDHITGLRYRGRHEGSLEDGYIGSGTKFLEEYSIRPNDFSRIILWYSENTTVKEICEKEYLFLSEIQDDELFYGKNKKYYNQVKNSFGYTSESNPMKIPEVVEKMKETQKRLELKNPWQNTVEKYGYKKACDMNRKVGNTNGSGNKGKTKSSEHKKNISANRKGGKPKGWRKNSIIL